MFNNLLDPVFNPLLGMPSVIAIMIIALVISVIVTFVYKFTTNQSLMKDLKNELKDFQKEIKELRNHPEQALAVQKKAMETNMKYMSHSMKSTLFTIIPVIIIFGWLNAHLAFDPLLPNQEFTVTTTVRSGVETVTLVVPEGITVDGNLTKRVYDSQAVWVLKGESGNYMLEFEADGEIIEKDLIITTEKSYSQPVKKSRGNIRQIEIGNKENIVLNILGWKVGWLGTYIIFSIIFSMLLRKYFKVY